jgi:hypothetical protein
MMQLLVAAKDTKRESCINFRKRIRVKIMTKLRDLTAARRKAVSPIIVVETIWIYGCVING